MRDKDRIDIFAKELAKIWKEECPDWRFGQLISNVFAGVDPFYLEEDQAIECFRAYFKR